MKEKVKALWKLCFDDSDQFIDMYFRLRYKSEINVVIESGNEVISALQMLPYPMSFCGKQVATSYISGACTHPDFRNRGVMRQLLSQAFARMLPNGDLLQYTDTGKSVAIRLLCTHRICSGVSIFYERNHSSGVYSFQRNKG